MTKTEKNNFVYSEIQFIVNRTDNDAIYKCSAKNDAIDIPLFQTVKFNVYCKLNGFLFDEISLSYVTFPLDFILHSGLLDSQLTLPSS